MTDIKNVIKELEAIGIHDVKEVVYNPSYEQLFEEETKPGLEGFEKGTLTTQYLLWYHLKRCIYLSVNDR